jgi:hypothetical protein
MDNFTIIKYGFLGSKTLINSFTNQGNNKQILDPLSCIVRLSLLIFKEKYTKISIANNKIFFQPPNILQGTIRWTYGDGRYDLHNLCNPIEKAILWYDPKNNKFIENIFKLSIKGLIKLKHSYIMKNTKVGDSNLVCHSISHYITLIENRLNNVDTITISKNNSDNNYFKTLWKDSEIEIINNLLSLALEKKNKNEEFTYTINAIETILLEKDNNVEKIVNKISTSI